MVLQVTGVQFVNQGLSTALQGLTQYNNALLKTTQTVINSTRTINNQYSEISNKTIKNFTLIGQGARDFSSHMSTAHTGVLRFTGGLKNLILAMTGFILLKRIINELLDSFKALFTTMIEGASNTQLLLIRFQNLTAINIQNTQGIQDYATALRMAKGPAIDLLDWVNVMAAKTIFGRDAIADVVGLGMAFDLSAGQSQTLSKAMIDWAAGMGLGNDALQRMVVNFGQMMRMGKITQRELRDLAIGGLFPVNEALRRIGEAAGMTGEQLKSFMQKTATSGMPVNALLKEFVEIAEERFPNAGERMAETWAGVTQNIKDFVTTILGAALLGPTMNKIVDSLSKLLKHALSPEVRATATVIGEYLATSLEKVVYNLRIFLNVIGDLLKAIGITLPSVKQLVAGFQVLANNISYGLRLASSAIRDWIDESGSTMAEGAGKFLKWGTELVMQFAIGLIQGAMTALTFAMYIISGILSFFLSPGSPPRVAPDIDKWGQSAMNYFLLGMTQADFAGQGHVLGEKLAGPVQDAVDDVVSSTAASAGVVSSSMEAWGKSAMNSFLKGMSKADFDILKDLQGPIQSALNVMAALGMIAKDQVGKIFYDISKQIIAAMHQLEKTGKVGEAVFRAIRKAGGELGDELEELARRQFALLAAMKEVEKAQKALTDARKADELASQRVDDLTKQYRELVEAGASKDILDAKRAEIKAAMDEQEATEESVSAAEERVKSAEDALDPLKEAVDLQEQMVQQMIALAQAQGDATKSAGEGAAGFASTLGDALAEFDDDMWATRIKMEIMQRGMRLQMEEMVTGMQTKLEEMFAPLAEKWKKEIQPAFDNLVKSFNNLSTQLDKIFGPLSGDTETGKVVQNIGKIVGAVLGFRVVLGFLGWLISPIMTFVKWIGTLAGTLLGIKGTLGGIAAFFLSIPGLLLSIGIGLVLIYLLRDRVKEVFASLGNLMMSFLVWLFNYGIPELVKFANMVLDYVSDTFLPQVLGTIVTWIAGENGLIVQLVKLGASAGIAFAQAILKGIASILGVANLGSLIPDIDIDLTSIVNDIFADIFGGGKASGGLVTQKGLYPLAERGPEMVIPAGLTSSFLKAAHAMVSYNRGPVSARPVFAGTTNNASNRNYNLSMSTMKSSGNVAHDFAIMETLAG
jgi:tape measure domain-containing protein